MRALAGERHRARATIGQLDQRAKCSYVPPSAFAFVYLGLGDDDATFDWLGRCVEERDALMPWMKFVPCFDRLRSDPRFDTLLERIGLAGLLAQARAC